MDVDRVFKKQRGIVLSLKQWEKIGKAIPYIDNKVAIVKDRMKKRMK